MLLQLLEVRAAGVAVPEAYHAIFPPLLTPTFWERPGNVPALVRLLQAYLSRAVAEVVSRGYLQVRCGAVGWRLTEVQCCVMEWQNGRRKGMGIRCNLQ